MDDTISTSAEAFEASALPRRCDTHTEDAPAPQDLPESMTKTPVDQKSPARWAYERLALYIQNFEEQLDAEHEIAMATPAATPEFCASKASVISTPTSSPFTDLTRRGRKCS